METTWNYDMDGVGFSFNCRFMSVNIVKFLPFKQTFLLLMPKIWFKFNNIVPILNVQYIFSCLDLNLDLVGLFGVL